VYRWLELNGKRFARGFTRAPARLGGEGAIWITLR
jgi:DNA-nicking Smr family endonuclease